jgi:Rhodopirellula transposase DDE domain
VVDTYTAGDPMQDGVLWTNLTRSEIAAGLQEQGFAVSVTVVDRLLEAFHLRQRKPRKIKTMRHDPHRDAQFRHIAKLKRESLQAGLPVISMDTKKREMLGDYVRPGRVLSSAPLRGWDHDFPTHSSGVVIPHGLYDLALNEGYLHLGDSHDTSEFAADALIDWWRRYGRVRYPQAAAMLLLCDSGGSNGVHRLVFKEQLQRVVDATDLLIKVAHYPPGCSKFNPIDHRLFPHVTRKLQGLAMFRELAKRATTHTGLRVFARSLRGMYELGKHATVKSAEQLRICYERVLPNWNYIVIPKPIWDVI